LVGDFCFAIAAMSGTHVTCFPNGCGCSIHDLKQNIHISLRIIESVPTFLPLDFVAQRVAAWQQILILLYAKDSCRDFVHVHQFAIFFVDKHIDIMGVISTLLNYRAERQSASE